MSIKGNFFWKNDKANGFAIGYSNPDFLSNIVECGKKTAEMIRSGKFPMKEVIKQTQDACHNLRIDDNDIESSVVFCSNIYALTDVGWKETKTDFTGCQFLQSV